MFDRRSFLAHVTVKQTDGSIVVVLANSGDGRNVNLRVGSRTASLTITSDSDDAQMELS